MELSVQNSLELVVEEVKDLSYDGLRVYDSYSFL